MGIVGEEQRELRRGGRHRLALRRDEIAGCGADHRAAERRQRLLTGPVSFLDGDLDIDRERLVRLIAHQTSPGVAAPSAS